MDFQREVSITDVQERLARVLGPRASEVVMSTAQRLIEQGRAEGEARGARRVLGLQLRSRFGVLDPQTEKRLEAASVEELERWAERVVDARTLADVFGR
jgi:hypothetical protein